MRMLTRRNVLKAGLGGVAIGAGLGGYALAEPFRLSITNYQVSPKSWPCGLRLRLAALADLHICEPFMGLEKLRYIVERTNALAPDAVLLLGDFVPGNAMSRIVRRLPGGAVIEKEAWADVLAELKAPHGVHAVMGNHDWWEDATAQRQRGGPVEVARLLRRVGINALENEAKRIIKDGQPAWIAGLGDQWALHPLPGVPADPVTWYHGVDNLAGTLAQTAPDEPVILMAHEPDIFDDVARLARPVALTVSGHTHGGQVRLAGYAPTVPSRFGQRYAYGHVREAGRDLVVSGGLGCSILPIRFGAPPEIVMIELSAPATTASRGRNPEHTPS